MGSALTPATLEDPQDFFPTQETRASQTPDDTEGDFSDEFNLLAQVAQPRPGCRADIFNEERTGRLMLVQARRSSVEKTAKETLKFRAQPN
jgi:hypothetical protein